MTNRKLLIYALLALLATLVPVTPAGAQQTPDAHGVPATAGHAAARAAHAAGHAWGVVSDDERAIAAVARQLFDGMRAGDSAAVRAVFHPAVRMVTTFRRGSEPVISIEESMDGFVQAVGTPHDEVWDERIWNLIIHTHNDLGIAWMNYAFFAGSRFSHCGVNLMELVRTPAGWKIIGLADTRQLEGCEVPESLR